MKILDKISNKISEIQSKPEKEKTRIIWVWAIIVTLVIAAGWAIFFKKYELIPKAAPGPQLPSVGDDLKEKVGGSFKDLRDKALPELREIIKEGQVKNGETENSDTN